MKMLKTRKDLLVLESDLNRVLLLAEVGAMKHEIHRLTGPVFLATPLAAQAIQIISSITSVFRQGKPAKHTKFSAVFLLVRCLRAGVVLWSGLQDMTNGHRRSRD